MTADQGAISFPEFRASLEGEGLPDLEIAKRYLAQFGDTPELQKQLQAMLLWGTEVAAEPATVVVLVHGILTFGEWQQVFVDELNLVAPSVTVYPISFGYCAWRFVAPRSMRERYVARVESELLAARREHPNATLVVIAHSFGTYLVSEVIRRNASIKLDRLILCGAVVRRDYDWQTIRQRPRHPNVVNDVGMLDNWPIVARHLKSDYGDAGRFGFGTIGVYDRWFSLDHSGFFTRDHFRKFWAPFVTRGQVVPSPDSANRSAPSLAKAIFYHSPGITIAAALIVVGLLAGCGLWLSH